MKIPSTADIANAILDSHNVVSLNLNQTVEASKNESSPASDLSQKFKKQSKMLSLLMTRYKKLLKDFSESEYKARLLKIELNELKDAYATQSGLDSQAEDGSIISSTIADQLRSLQNNQDFLIRQQKQEKKILDEVLSSTGTSNTWLSIQNHMPKESGIYLLTNGVRQCVGFYNNEEKRFSPTSFFNQPTHWMPQPKLPNIEM
jgi:hypothetical protein